MKLAIVGTGISGMVAAYLLHREHEVTVFEAKDYIGGHTNTVTVDRHGTSYAVDTGFIVFNDWTYPQFIALLNRLGVESQPSDMSFSVRCERTGLEYGGTTLNTLFAQRRNFLRPSFYRMIRDILRFNREAPLLLHDAGPGPSLGGYLEANRYSSEFIQHYIIRWELRSGLPVMPGCGNSPSSISSSFSKTTACCRWMNDRHGGSSRGGRKHTPNN